MTHNLSSRCRLQERGLTRADSLHPRGRLPGWARRFGGILALIVCALAGHPALAQRQVTQVPLQIKAGGNLVYWFTTRSNAATAPAPLKTPIAVPPGFQNNPRLEVLDVATGKVAHLPIRSSSALTLDEKDFTYAQTVQVPVVWNDQPVQGLLVSLQYPDEEWGTVRRNYWLQPSDNGYARFTDVPLNKQVTVTVSNGAASSPTVGEVTQQNGAYVLNKKVEVPTNWTGIQAVAAPKAAVSLPPAPVQQTPSPNNGLVGALVSTLIGVVVLAVGLFWLVDSGKLNSLFGKLGIQPAPTMGQPVPAFAGPGGKARPSPVPSEAVAPAGGATNVPQVGPRLVATMGTYAGSIFPLAESHVAIGREAANAIALTQDNATSRRHAHIQVSNGQYILVDDGSSNGTYVNGVRITSQRPQPLRPGDEVIIGTTHFRFEL